MLGANSRIEHQFRTYLQLKRKHVLEGVGLGRSGNTDFRSSSVSGEESIGMGAGLVVRSSTLSVQIIGTCSAAVDCIFEL